MQFAYRRLHEFQKILNPCVGPTTFEILYSLAGVYKFYSCGATFLTSSNPENLKTHQKILNFFNLLCKPEFCKLILGNNILNFTNSGNEKCRKYVRNFIP